MVGNLAKTAVIIGAGSRIGKEIATELARRGFRLGIIDCGMDDPRSTLKAVEKANGMVELGTCEVRDLEEVQFMAEQFFDAWGEVGLLVNDPGLDDCGRYAGDIPVEEWREVIDANVMGVVYACHAFIPRMIEQGGGHIANGTYGAGLVTAKEAAPYDIARAGVISYTERLRTELAPCNIGVTMLSSSPINTKLIDGWLKKAGFELRTKVLSKEENA